MAYTGSLDLQTIMKDVGRHLAASNQKMPMPKAPFALNRLIGHTTDSCLEVLTHQKVFALFVLLAALPVLAQEAQEDSGDGGLQPCEPEEVPPPLPLAISAPSILFLIVMSGLFSGLTLGLMGLDVIALQIVQKGDDKVLARCAEQIAPVREKGNQLLCTLLLGNVAVNSALSILSADIFSGTVGFVVSTATIVIFGEIIPQAACSRYALQVGARTVPLVKVLMLVFFVLAKPISICLDWMLGQEMGTVHSRTVRSSLLQKHMVRNGLCVMAKKYHA